MAEGTGAWLKSAQARRGLQWSGKLLHNPAVILEEQERLMKLAWDRRHPSKDLAFLAVLDHERVKDELLAKGPRHPAVRKYWKEKSVNTEYAAIGNGKSPIIQEVTSPVQTEKSDVLAVVATSPKRASTGRTRMPAEQEAFRLAERERIRAYRAKRKAGR